jgi:hypothetical protein
MRSLAAALAILSTRRIWRPLSMTANFILPALIRPMPPMKRPTWRWRSCACDGRRCASCSSRARWTDGAGMGEWANGDLVTGNLVTHDPASRAADWEDWERPLWTQKTPAVPILPLDGFDGPMDLLLDLAERQRIDFGRMSILALAEQFVVALARLAVRVPIERRADWLVMATRLVLLRSRLLFPASPASVEAAERDAATELRRIGDLAEVRAAAA